MKILLVWLQNISLTVCICFIVVNSGSVSAYAVGGEHSALTAKMDSTVNDGIKAAHYEAGELMYLKTVLEDFFRNELMRFNDNALYRPMEDRKQYIRTHEDDILEKAIEVDTTLESYFPAKKSHIADICRVIFSISREGETFQKLAELRRFVHIINTRVLNDPLLGYYLFVDAPRVRQKRLIILPCIITENHEIPFNSQETLNVFKLELLTHKEEEKPGLWRSILGTRKLHDHLQQLPFHAKYVPGTNHVCINERSVEDETKRIYDGYRFTIARSQDEGLFVGEGYDAAILSLISRDFMEDSTSSYKQTVEIKDIRSWQDFNTILYLYGKVKGSDFYPPYEFPADEKHFVPAMHRYGIERVLDEITGATVAISYGKKILATEVRRLLRNVEQNDPDQRLSLSSRYMLMRMAEMFPRYVTLFDEDEFDRIKKDIYFKQRKQGYSSLIMFMLDNGFNEMMARDMGFKMLEGGIDYGLLYELIKHLWPNISPYEYGVVVGGMHQRLLHYSAREEIEYLFTHISSFKRNLAIDQSHIKSA